MNRLLLAFTLGLSLAACGGGNGGSAVDMAVALPTPVNFTDKGATKPADESCNGKRIDPMPPTMDTIVNGTIKDFENSQPVENAIVSLYLTAGDAVNNKPAAMSTPSDAMGNYTITVPKGHYRVTFGNQGGMALSNGQPVSTIPAYEFNRVYSDKERAAVKKTTKEAIAGIVSIIPDDSLGVVAGSVHDCGDKILGGAEVSLSKTSSPYDSSSLVFYFVNAGGSQLPVRTAHWTSNDPGVYAALNVPTGTAQVNATGIIGSGALQSLGAETVPIIAGAITIVDVLPASM